MKEQQTKRRSRQLARDIGRLLDYWQWRHARGLAPTADQCERFERWREMLAESVGAELVEEES